MRFTQTFAATLLAAAFCTAANAQSTGAIGGYTLGFVYDARVSAMRPLAGIPGAAVIGPPLDAGQPIRQAYLAPRQNYAVALTDGGALLLQFVSASDPPVVTPLGFDSTAARIAALSPDGSAGAFYSADEAVIRVVTGLPASPTVDRRVTTAAVSGAIRLLAISNDGAALVAAADGTATDEIVLLDSAGNAGALTNSTHVGALQFAGDAKDLLVADDSDDTVFVIRDVSGAALPQLLADSDSGIAGPVGLNTSSDGRLIVANGRGANIVLFATDGSQLGAYSCPCTPAGLNRLNGSAVFQLNSISTTDPLWIFDGDSTTPRVVFVPVDQSESSGAGQ